VGDCLRVGNAQFPLRMFLRNFPIDGEAANLLRSCQRHGQQVVNKPLSWNLGNDTTQQTQWTFARGNFVWTCHLCCGLVVDLLWGSRQLVTDLLRGNWCTGNGFWP